MRHSEACPTSGPMRFRCLSDVIPTRFRRLSDTMFPMRFRRLSEAFPTSVRYISDAFPVIIDFNEGHVRRVLCAQDLEWHRSFLQWSLIVREVVYMY